MNWLKKRLKSKTIWLTSIAPTALVFMSKYEANLQILLQDYYQYAFIFFALLAWPLREVTKSGLDDK